MPDCRQKWRLQGNNLHLQSDVWAWALGPPLGCSSWWQLVEGWEVPSRPSSTYQVTQCKAKLSEGSPSQKDPHFSLSSLCLHEETRHEKMRMVFRRTVLSQQDGNCVGKSFHRWHIYANTYFKNLHTCVLFLYIWVHVYVHIYVHICVCKPQAGVHYPPQLFSVINFEAWSLTEPKARHSAILSGESLGSTCHPGNLPGILGTCHQAQILHRCWTSKVR